MMIDQDITIEIVGMTDVTTTTKNLAAKRAGRNMKEAKTTAETTIDNKDEVAAEVPKETEDTDVQDRQATNVG